MRTIGYGVAVLGLVVVVGCRGKRASEREPGSHAASAATDEERWGGAILIPTQPPLEFELRWTPGPSPRATMAIPAQHLPATALTGVTAAGTAMTFTLEPPGAQPAAYAHFAVERGDDGRTARGTLHQHGAELVVQMRRLAAGETVADGPVRPQLPKPPFPYDSREASYQSKDGTTLAGTLTVPRGGGPYPAVLLITGTGAQDRDEALMGHRPFLVLADHLTRNGIAVLRVDDRGVGGSSGDTAATDLEGKTDDALAGLAWLARQPDLDPARLGLIGHSEGGLIAPMAAARVGTTPPIAFIVLLAGPGKSGAEISVSQLELMMKVAGVAPAVIAARVVGQRRLLAAQAATADPVELRAAVAEQVDLLVRIGTPAERAQLTGAGREAAIDNGVAGLASAASRSFSMTDPAPFLEQVRCPVLALGGSLDLQVPAEDNLARVHGALVRGGNLDVTTELLPGLNHLFQPAKRGLVEEYALIETTFDPGALGRISDWLRARAGLR